MVFTCHDTRPESGNISLSTHSKFSRHHTMPRTTHSKFSRHMQRWTHTMLVIRAFADF